MSLDIATLGIKVDASQVSNASGELKILVDVGVKAEKATDGLRDSFGGLKTAIAGLGLGALVREGIQLADTYANIQGRLSLVTNGTAELNSVTEKLFESAQRSRASFEATSDLYSSLARSTKSLGTSQRDLLQVTETINKALIVSGASAATAEGALVQLGQGFASGTLRGDELNAVLEGTPRLAQAIADGMGVTVGQLRALGAEGKITGETVFNALKSQKDAVEKEFAKMPTTVAQSFTVLQNEIMRYVGQANQASGVTSVVSASVAGFARNLDIIVPIVGALGVALGVGFVARAVAAQVAAAGTATALGAMGVAARGAGASLLGAFGGPVGLAITAVTLAVGGLVAQSMKAGAVVSTVNKSYDEMRKRLNDAKLAADGAASGSKGVGSAASGAIPGVNNFSGAVKSLADNLYRQADAAKKARIEMAANALAEAQKNEAAASENVGNVRGTRANEARRGDFYTNAGIIGGAISARVDSFLSGGRTDREAEDAYRKSVAVSVQARRDLIAAYRSSNSTISGASEVNAAEIKKLRGQVDDLKKIRGSLSGKERQRVDNRIAAGERKIELLGSGAAESAVNAAVGSGGSGGGGSGKSDKQREYESAVEASKQYAEQLAIERENIGKTAIEQRLADAAREASKAPTKALAEQIMSEANAWANATLAQQLNESARTALTEAMEQEKRASEEAQRAGQEMAGQIEFETNLQNMNVSQRAVAIAQRELETRGIKEGTVAWALYGETILNAAQAKGVLQEQADAAGNFADRMRAVNDNVRDATNGFAQLFGTAGQGFATLIEAVTDYAEQTANAEARVADARARYGEQSKEARDAQAQATEEAASREMATYGQVIRGVKGLFSQKSAAYKVMEGIEKTYAAIRLALAVKEIVTEGILTTTKVAGAGTRMAVDGAETASSVAKSGIRAAADGVAAFAKTVASLPFPFNLAAGAAVIAALVAVGVKITGGGSKKAASTAADSNVSAGQAYNGPTDEYGNPTSGYSVLKSGRTTVAGNDNQAYAGQAGYAANAGFMGISFGDTNLTIQGNVSEDTLPQVQAMLDANRQRTVEEARQAAAQDRAAAAERQRIGGR